MIVFMLSYLREMSRKKVILGDLNANKFESPLIVYSCSEKTPFFYKKMVFPIKMEDKYRYIL